MKRSPPDDLTDLESAGQVTVAKWLTAKVCVCAHRWLDVSVANLTSTRSWVVYLQGVQEAVWPGGQLPAEAPPRRSRRQKDDTRREALRSLMSLLPGKDRHANAD